MVAAVHRDAALLAAVKVARGFSILDGTCNRMHKWMVRMGGCEDTVFSKGLMEALAVGSQKVLKMCFDWVDDCEEVVVTSGEVWPEGGTARLRRGKDICNVIACQFESMDLMMMPLSTEKSATVERIEAHDTSESKESENDAEDQVQ